MWRLLQLEINANEKNKSMPEGSSDWSNWLSRGQREGEDSWLLYSTFEKIQICPFRS